MDRHAHLRLVSPQPVRPEPMNPEPVAAEPSLTIDSHDCTLHDTDACDDCLVSHLLGPLPSRVELDHDEARQVELLTEAGLVPPSRFAPRHGVA